MNWPQVIKDLKAAGWTQVRLAIHCNTRQSTISDLHTGAVESPSYELGKALELLHAEVVKGKQEA